jgi:hypothetical protein
METKAPSPPALASFWLPEPKVNGSSLCDMGPTQRRVPQTAHSWGAAFSPSQGWESHFGHSAGSSGSPPIPDR